MEDMGLREDEFAVEVGEPVTMRAHLSGIEGPVKYRWQLGDGSIAAEREFSHLYGSPGDYPVRLKVTDGEGRGYRSAAYVVVRGREAGDTPRHLHGVIHAGEPVLHSTFEEDDGDWWWLWQTYRPGPTKSEKITEGGRSYLRIEAPEDGMRMPCWTFPAGWDIDRFPLVRLRYRASEGIPFALRLRAFSAEGEREVFAAATPDAYVPAESEEIAVTLHNDGNWHELELDARVIREVFPDVRVLEGLKFKAARWRDRDSVEKGHWYDIDEVYIGPGRAGSNQL